jgi:DNA-binding response OmpR family regulator
MTFTGRFRRTVIASKVAFCFTTASTARSSSSATRLGPGRITGAASRYPSLLEFLMRHPGNRCSRKDIFERVWGDTGGWTADDAALADA